MPKEWNDDEIKAEINAAVRIAREDGILSHVRNLHEKLDRILAGPSTDSDGNNGEGQPPPKQDPKPSNDQQVKKKRSLWWGEQDDDTEEKK